MRVDVFRRAVFGSDSNLMQFEMRVVPLQGTSAMQKAVRQSCLVPHRAERRPASFRSRD
jgi:hypothetical protein